MINPKCPFCDAEMKASAPFYDKYSGKYTSHAKCWECGAQGPLAKSGSSSIVTNRALRNALNRPLRKALRWQQIETYTVVWIEYVDKKEVIPVFPEPVYDKDVMCFLTAEQEFITLNKGDYGKRWRVWAKMPTEQERTATAWKG